MAALALVLWVLDPNDYKPQIEKLVEERTNLDLNLEGDIGWSLFPLGLELNKVDAQLDNERLLKLDTLTARVSLLSLLKMQPSVHTFVLHGLAMNLVRNRDGSGNWERIFPEKTAAEKAEQARKKPESTQADAEGILVFNISKVDIRDARLHYRDEGNGQSLLLDELSLQASDIAPGQAFPLDLSFHFANVDPELDVRAELEGLFSFDENFQALAIDNLSSEFQLSGTPFNERTVPATAKGNLKADLEQETVSLKGLVVTLANLTLKSDLEVEGLSGSPLVKGQVEIPAFSPRELLAQLGQADLSTSDPAVLDKLTLRADIGGEPGRIALAPLNIALDDSTLKGTLTHVVDNGAINGQLRLDRINLDRYLPPEPEQEAQAKKEEKTAAAESDLLPLETLRTLRWDLRFEIGELIVNKLTTTEVKLTSTAADGQIAVKPLSGKLYEGSFNLNATVAADKDTPVWKLQGAVKNVQTLPLLSNAADVTQFSGLANIDLNINSKGNRTSVLRSNAQGQANFDIASGKFDGTSLQAYACEGIALVHRESIDTSAWPKETSFEALTGKLLINGNILNNTGLTAKVKGLAVEGVGEIDTQKMLLDYKAGLRVIGTVHEDPACRVNERLKGVVIPVKCQGPLAGEEGLPCKFDTARFRDTLKGMAKQEVKQKVEEEKDRTEDKLRDKAREKLEGFFK